MSLNLSFQISNELESERYVCLVEGYPDCAATGNTPELAKRNAFSLVVDKLQKLDKYLAVQMKYWKEYEAV